ncbi:secretory carrier membrane protein 3 [Trypanosoma rangeli]|uniref:Secretory carrier membrane protein 3 n=1 Tax=Trypanosoma rangeli TaxID=5698 RepID=A0A3R7KLV8_TRYRA|nr:secretory carrier membrane protein 3 [Trypanosoma rangeli]RNF10056.1 secretory carrier membrane protein 3 [Trypanosoma rangeli]|eukprot:RNF10056.1 secretory carrier membrane protein 3 [Trypanosoma rangeli]
MYNFGKEVNDLKNTYNFGGTTQHNTERLNESSLSERRHRSMEVGGQPHNNEDETKPYEQQYPHTGATLTAHALSHSSVFPSDLPSRSVFSDPQETSTLGVSTEHRKEKKEESTTVQIAKEVLGLNKTNTSGMSFEEKERVLLQERWRRAMAEENRLKALEERVIIHERETASAGLTPNFPPKFLCIKPIVHHDIERVPEARRNFVRLNYINWIATCVMLLLNTIVAIAVVSAPYKKGAEKKFKLAQNIVLAVVYLIGAPLSFILWYWPVYSACSTGSTTKHLTSLCGLIVALAFTIFIVVGQTNYAACGVDFAIDISETKHKLFVVPVTIVLVLWIAEGVWLCYCIAKQWVYYRLDVNAQQEVRHQMHSVIGV